MLTVTVKSLGYSFSFLLGHVGLTPTRIAMPHSLSSRS